MRKAAWVWKNVAAGIAGGLLGSWTMNQFQALVSRTTAASSDSGQNTQPQQPAAEPATVKAAREISTRLFHHKPSDAEKEPAGEVMHYAMGAVSGIAYALTAEQLAPATWGHGLLFGTVLWLVADEGAVFALGLSKAPTEYPASSHANAWASHVVYGVMTDLVRRGLLRLR